MKAWTCGNCRARAVHALEVLAVHDVGKEECCVCGRLAADVCLLRTRDAIRIIGLFLGDLTEVEHKAMGSTRVDGRVRL